MTKVSYWQLFWVFFKISACTVGGGYAMLPVFEEELVKKRGWLSAEIMLTTLAAAQSCPGLIAVNAALFAGTLTRGFAGGITAVLGVVIPPFAAIVLLANFLEKITDMAVVGAALAGVRSGVAALILVTLVTLGKKTLRGKTAWLLAISAFAAITWFKVNPVWVILTGAAAGLLCPLTGSDEKSPGGKA